MKCTIISEADTHNELLRKHHCDKIIKISKTTLCQFNPVDHKGKGNLLNKITRMEMQAVW